MRNDITIGMDLGNRKHKVFGIDRDGNKEQVELLMTVPGVGPITSCAFVAHVADPKKFGRHGAQAIRAENMRPGRKGGPPEG